MNGDYLRRRFKAASWHNPAFFIAPGFKTIASTLQNDGVPPLRIGTRGSQLALAQAHELRQRLATAHILDPAQFEIEIVRTTGDAIQDRPLSEAGGKGLFTKELDTALIEGRIDIAVHSAKDLPTILPPEITIIGYLPREDIRDAWISATAADPHALPRGAVVGTASLRRAAMVKRLRPDLAITLLRGNVETRLDKVMRGEVDATLLALAGLKRLGLADKITAILSAEDFVPAVGQGAIAITGRHDDARIAAFVAPILDAPTGLALGCERALLRILDGSCRTPIGGSATIEGTELSLHAIILRPDGSAFFEARQRGPQSQAERIGETVARTLLAQAPKDFLEA
jgi:hydroxymethylbilane synthase